MPESNDQLNESHNGPEVYRLAKKQIALLGTIPLALFLLIILINLPVSSGLHSFVENNILKTRSCPMSYKKMELSYFFPGISLSDLSIPGRCFNNPTKTLHFEKVNFKFSFPSFWPIGIKTKLSANFKDTHINVYPRLTISGHSIQISNTDITTAFINQITPNPNMLGGDFNVKGNIELKSNQIDSAHLLINSKDLFVPAQSIMGIKIPAMPLKKFELAANVAKNQVQVKALRIGNSTADIQAELKGTLALAKSNINYSKLNLQGKFKISREVQEALPLLRLLLNGKKKKDGYYFISIGGTLAAPVPKVVDPQ